MIMYIIMIIIMHDGHTSNLDDADYLIISVRNCRHTRDTVTSLDVSYDMAIRSKNKKVHLPEPESTLSLFWNDKTKQLYNV